MTIWLMEIGTFLPTVFAGGACPRVCGELSHSSIRCSILCSVVAIALNSIASASAADGLSDAKREYSSAAKQLDEAYKKAIADAEATGQHDDTINLRQAMEAFAYLSSEVNRTYDALSVGQKLDTAIQRESANQQAFGHLKKKVTNKLYTAEFVVGGVERANPGMYSIKLDSIFQLQNENMDPHGSLKSYTMNLSETEAMRIHAGDRLVLRGKLQTEPPAVPPVVELVRLQFPCEGGPINGFPIWLTSSRAQIIHDRGKNRSNGP